MTLSGMTEHGDVLLNFYTVALALAELTTDIYATQPHSRRHWAYLEYGNGFGALCPPIRPVL